MKLHGYFRSSAAYRVRIALALKGLSYDHVPVHLLRDGGEQRKEAYLRLNPQGLVPALEDGDAVLTQSLAIVEYLEERHPAPPLLPRDAADRARVRAMALAVACEIHPLNNLRVLNYLRERLGLDQAARNAWYCHWIETGLGQLEQLVAAGGRVGPFCWGATPTLADVCLVPQMANARRLPCDLGACPTLVAIDAHCRTLPAFIAAAPENQPDAEPAR